MFLCLFLRLSLHCQTTISFSYVYFSQEVDLLTVATHFFYTNKGFVKVNGSENEEVKASCLTAIQSLEVNENV